MSSIKIVRNVNIGKFTSKMKKQSWLPIIKHVNYSVSKISKKSIRNWLLLNIFKLISSLSMRLVSFLNWCLSIGIILTIWYSIFRTIMNKKLLDMYVIDRINRINYTGLCLTSAGCATPSLHAAVPTGWTRAPGIRLSLAATQGTTAPSFKSNQSLSPGRLEVDHVEKVLEASL